MVDIWWLRCRVFFTQIKTICRHCINICNTAVCCVIAADRGSGVWVLIWFIIEVSAPCCLSFVQRTWRLFCTLVLCRVIKRGFCLRHFSRSGELLLCKKTSLVMQHCTQVEALHCFLNSHFEEHINISTYSKKKKTGLCIICLLQMNSGSSCIFISACSTNLWNTVFIFNKMALSLAFL